MQLLPNQLLVGIAINEAVLVLFALGLFFGHALWMRWEEARYADLMAEGRAALTRAIGSGEVAPGDLAMLARLPLNRQAQLMSEWEANLSGQGSVVMGSVSQQLGMVTTAERMCHSRRWAQRVRGIRILTVLTEGSQVVPKLFRDGSAVVRSQAAYWAAAHPTPESIKALLHMLSDPDRFCRFAAMDSLHRMGTVVLDPLVEFVTKEQGPSVEFAMAVISAMGHEQFVDVACSMITAESAVTRAFAVRVLGTAGGAAHMEVLLDCLHDPSATVREAAATSIGGLGHWPAAPYLAVLLADADWNVRRASAMALRSLGAPGHLFLRRALKGSDRYAVDMAHHVLDMPDPLNMARAS